MKLINTIILIIAALFASSWIFNFVNPWVGVATGFGVGYFITYRLVTFFTKNDSEESKQDGLENESVKNGDVKNESTKNESN